MSPHAVSGRDVRFHSNSATTLTLFCFPPAALCVLDAAHNPNPNVKLSGVQYLKEGEEREIPCIWEHDPHTSLARCTRGKVTLFTCKCRRFHLITHHVLFFEKKKEIFLHKTNNYVEAFCVSNCWLVFLMVFPFRLPIIWASLGE